MATDDSTIINFAQRRALRCETSGSVTKEKAENRERIEALWVANYGWMVQLAWLLTGSQASGQDAVSEAWLRCWDKLDDLDTPAAYLRTAIVNVCLNQKRHEKVIDRFTRSRHQQYEPTAGEEQTEILEMLKGLPRRQRSVLVLRYLYDMTDEEIADELGMRATTVRSNARHGIGALRSRIRQSSEGDGDERT